MNVHTMCFSKALRYAVVTSLLFMAVSFTSVANAAQGCGEGYHRSIYNGTCVLNYPGPFATPAPAHPGCWRNMWGQLRCYRY
ncbi:hypothetical protein D7217_14690 [Legionella pneumophila]|uniref:GCG_CRPN prefix-to-repeats domain-containing protein n=1 Tax=Legionella pneumophila TaxID=446 RepID=UPI0010223968|nr:hypothetical protein [Legionella pneumophila]RYW86717.1 hypothetical protein D7217_14690 [Legionella pneumophila]HAT2094875.1 hypothetical protein [Legionella pneumophila]HAU1190291.1 hypothetical protein [Legionella pneumophila]HAU1624391.1 hypothetical protein [Legionella pneumophila]HAW6255889.1 hypothetical protein [Legionella pneumophila]